MDDHLVDRPSFEPEPRGPYQSHYVVDGLFNDGECDDIIGLGNSLDGEESMLESIDGSDADSTSSMNPSASESRSR